MSGLLGAGQIVHWTRHLHFLPSKGIEHEPSGFLGRKESMVIPFADIASYDIEQGIFRARVKGKKSAAIEERVSEPNFFPGFFLFLATTKAPITPKK